MTLHRTPTENCGAGAQQSRNNQATKWRREWESASQACFSLQVCDHREHCGQFIIGKLGKFTSKNRIIIEKTRLRQAKNKTKRDTLSTIIQYQ